MIYLSCKTQSAKFDALRQAGIGVMIVYPQSVKPASSGLTFAVDNGCFTNPDLSATNYLGWLDRIPRSALFAPAPDVVGDSRATWERSSSVLGRIRALGHRAALVAQDGIESRPIRWGAFDCLFIGGTDDWKFSEGARWLIREARRQGKFIHAGRVNSRVRLRYFARLGCDSADGTHIRFRPDRYTRQVKGWLDELKRQPFLPVSGDEAETDLIVDLNLLY